MTYRLSITIPGKCNQVPYHRVTGVHVRCGQANMLITILGRKEEGARYEQEILLPSDASITIEGEDWE